jgi:hypothetical protein
MKEITARQLATDSSTYWPDLEYEFTDGHRVFI